MISFDEFLKQFDQNLVAIKIDKTEAFKSLCEALTAEGYTVFAGGYENVHDIHGYALSRIYRYGYIGSAGDKRITGYRDRLYKYMATQISLWDDSELESILAL